MFSWFKQSVSGTLGIEISPFGVAVAHLSDKSEVQLQKAECAYFDQAIEHCLDELSDWIAERDLDNISAKVALHPSLYNLYFVDRPDVEDEDLSEAVRWKLKDLVDVPLKDLVVDAFPLPSDAYRGNQKKVYVAAIEKTILEDIVTYLRRLPINLSGISIGELTDCSILNLMHQQSAGAALLRLRYANGSINLVDDGDLYLTRSIESGVSFIEGASDANRGAVLEELLLQIQRCLDFYDSQLGKGAIRTILIAPTKLERNFFDEHLRDHLGLNVQTLDLNDAFEFSESMSGQMQSRCFAAVAAAVVNDREVA